MIADPRSPLRRRTRWLWGPAAAVGVAALLLLPDRNADDPDVLAHLECHAGAVALDQYLHGRATVGQTVPVDLMDAYTPRAKHLSDYAAGLRRRDDPHLVHVRPLIARAETERDAAVANDGEAYMQDAMTRLRTCHDTLYSKAL